MKCWHCSCLFLALFLLCSCCVLVVFLLCSSCVLAVFLLCSCSDMQLCKGIFCLCTLSHFLANSTVLFVWLLNLFVCCVSCSELHWWCQSMDLCIFSKVIFFLKVYFSQAGEKGRSWELKSSAWVDFLKVIFVKVYFWKEYFPDQISCKRDGPRNRFEILGLGGEGAGCQGGIAGRPLARIYGVLLKWK